MKQPLDFRGPEVPRRAQGSRDAKISREIVHEAEMARQGEQIGAFLSSGDSAQILEKMGHLMGDGVLGQAIGIYPDPRFLARGEAGRGLGQPDLDRRAIELGKEVTDLPDAL